MNITDPELDHVPVRAADPAWPYCLLGVAFVAVPALIALAAYFASLSHPPASGTPTIEDCHDR